MMYCVVKRHEQPAGYGAIEIKVLLLLLSMTEPLRNHGDHGGATAVYAVHRSGTGPPV